MTGRARRGRFASLLACWLVIGLGSALALVTPSGEGRAQSAASRREVIAVERDGAVQDVWVLLPTGRHAPESLAVIVALHGRGEALRGPRRGARGWLDDYALEAAFAALRRGRVQPDDVAGMASDAQLRAMRRALTAHPFRDVAIVMPYTPDLMGETAGSPAVLAYGDWLTNTMLPRVRAQIPALSHDAARTAIDGVSLGGMLALDVGLRHPTHFASVGGIQAAIRGRVEAYGALASTQTPCLRLASSTRDPFLGVNRELATRWRARGLSPELVEYSGPHNYAFNRGPGSVELLRFHHTCFARRAR